MKFIHNLKAGLLAAMVPAVLLSGCTSDDQFNTRAQGAGAGAVVGAGVGALLGSLSGDAGRGALIGAAIGTAGGLAVGDHVARKKARYANTEAYLDACIASAQKVNADAYAYNRSLSNRIASLEREIRIAVGSGDRATMRAKKKEVLALQNEAQAQVKVVSEEISVQRQVITAESGSSNVGGLRSEVTRLESARATTNSNIERLASLSNQVDI
jgi:hypothetical protein